MSAKRTKDKNRMSLSSRNSVDSGVPEYVTIVAEGRPVRAERHVIYKYSKVLKERLREVQNARDTALANFTREEGGIDKCGEWLRGMMTPEVQLDCPNMKYKELKLTMHFLMMLDSKLEMTEADARRVLPVVDEFKMANLKKKCDSVFLSVLDAKPEPEARHILEYLATADKYHLKETRKACVAKLSVKYDTTSRQQVSDDKHIEAKSKVDILNKMFDRLNADYERKLQQIKTDSDIRCNQISNNRDEFMSETREWKSQLSERVTTALEINERDHQEFVSMMHQNELLTKLNGQIEDFNGEIATDLEYLKTEMDAIIERLNEQQLEEHSPVDVEEYLTALKNAWEQTASNVHINSDAHNKQLKTQFSACSLTQPLQNCLEESCILLDKLERVYAELDEKIQAMTHSEIKNAELSLEVEKKESALIKHTKRSHDLNTWVKWAKPESDIAGPSTCFRHSSLPYRKLTLQA